MNNKAFTEMLSVLDDAIDLAETAVKSAELAQRRPEPVTLVKVASVRCAAVAKELMKTGAFQDNTGKDLAKSLEQAGPAELLEFLEKLASRAVFPLYVDLFGKDGDLVDKPATTRTEAGSSESRTDLWERCCTEAGLG